MDRAMIPGALRRRRFRCRVGAGVWASWVAAVASGADVGVDVVIWALGARRSVAPRHVRFLGAVWVGCANKGGATSGR